MDFKIRDFRASTAHLREKNEDPDFFITLVCDECLDELSIPMVFFDPIHPKSFDRTAGWKIPDLIQQVQTEHQHTGALWTPAPAYEYKETPASNVKCLCPKCLGGLAESG